MKYPRLLPHLHFRTCQFINIRELAGSQAASSENRCGSFGAERLASPLRLFLFNQRDRDLRPQKVGRIIEFIRHTKSGKRVAVAPELCQRHPFVVKCFSVIGFRFCCFIEMGERLIVAAEFIQNGSATIPSFGDVRVSGQSMRQARVLQPAWSMISG